MNKIAIYILTLFFASIIFGACSKDFLEKEPLVDNVIENFYKTGNDAILAVNACYTPLEWEFNNTYFPEWMLGDIVSDDALKGGNGISDMQDLFQLENFIATPSNELLLEFYRAQFQGIFRCNLSIIKIPAIVPDETMDQNLKDRLIAEAKTLRALYYFRLVRVFGGVPKIDRFLSPSEYEQPRASREEIYQLIYSDLLEAIPGLWLKSEYPAEDMGRVTKGTAQALLMKAYLYNQQWQEARAWGDSVIFSGQYNLNANYANNFSLEGENGQESVFEIQYMEEPTSDYGDGNGFTRGTFTIVMQRTRVANAGWGFNHPTLNLISEFEPNDPRKDFTVASPDADAYLGNAYHNKKYALGNYVLAHPTRGPLNYKLIRYSDVLLMFAEAACESNDLVAAQNALEMVRARARAANASILPVFPYGNYTNTQEDLRAAIRHERRVELAMEGHRFFDLVRWGIADQVMNAYKEQESASVKVHMGNFQSGKHELFPIPESERNLNPKLSQNPNY